MKVYLEIIKQNHSTCIIVKDIYNLARLDYGDDDGLEGRCDIDESALGYLSLNPYIYYHVDGEEETRVG
ncbi:MAG: hypothetical protein QXW31_02085 [Nitrososphaerota archaeon]